MARSHAHLLSAIWSDPDWVALSQGAQRTYVLLLSQPKLTMVGLLDYLPSRWARLAADSTLASVEGDIAELEASRFVLADHATDEVLIRSLVRHEVNASKVANPKWLAGLWSAWAAIQSRQLRAGAVENLPTSVWDSPKVKPPAEATELRQTPWSRQKHQTEPSRGTFQQNVPQSPVTTDAVADFKQPVYSQGDDPQAAAAVDNSSVFEQALVLLTEREMLRNPSHTNPKRHYEATLRGKRRDHVARGHELLRMDPDASPDQLADALEPTDEPTSSRVTNDGVPFIPGTGRAAGLPAGESPWMQPPADVLAQARERLRHPNQEAS